VLRDKRDNEMFLDTLEEACGRCGWRVHAFVLMGNHYHLLLETPHANLVDGMRWLQGTYTKRFNLRHKVCGAIFSKAATRHCLLIPGVIISRRYAVIFISIRPGRTVLTFTKGG